jgi:hypothetical protein
MNFTYRDIIAVAISLVITAVAGYLLYGDITGHSTGTGDPVGTIAFKKRVAQRRLADDVIWEGLSQNGPVYNLDYVRTDSDSSATITFSDGTTIDLDENSMVLINLMNGKLSIGFEGGTISATSGSGSALDIIAGKTKIALKQGGLVLGGEKNRARLTVNTGRAEVLSGGSVASVSAEQSALLAGTSSTVEQNPLSLRIPESGSVIARTDSSPDIAFAWTGKAEAARIEIATNSRFTSVIRTGSGTGSFSTALPAGRYYWRVSQGSATSVPSSFTVLRVQNPVPLTPDRGAVFYTSGANPLIRFAWRSGDGVVGGRITIARSESLSDPVLALDAPTDSISVDSLQPGVYYWAIRSPVPGTDATSPVQSFSIERREKIPPVRLLYPADGTQLSIGKGAAKARLGWEKTESAKRYRVELFAAGGTSPAYSAESSDNFITLPESIAEGNYTWRVVSIDTQNRQSDPSESFRVRLSRFIPLRYVSPIEGAILETGANRFAWADGNGGSRYRIEFSATRAFSAIQKSVTVTATDTTITLDSPGRYFYRVALLDSDVGVLLAGPASGFSIPMPLASPEIVAPQTNTEIDLNKVNRIPLRWKPVTGANQYDITLKYRLAGSEVEIFRKSTTRTEFDITDFSRLKLGTLAFEVRAVIRRQNQIAATSRPSEAIFNLTMKNDLPAPVIINPGVIYVR